MRRCRCKEGFAKRLSATGAGGQAPLGLGDLWRGSQHLQGRAHIRERGRRGARSLWSHCILGSDCAVQGAVLLRRKSSLTSFALFSCRPDFTPFISISDLAPSPLPPPPPRLSHQGPMLSLFSFSRVCFLLRTPEHRQMTSHTWP